MSANANDIVGQTIHAITVLAHLGKNGGKYHLYLCRCACGKELVRLRQTLTRKAVRISCGCSRPASAGARNGMYKHGLVKTRAYSTWNSLKQRCLNPTNPKYPLYGGRGILVCERWGEFANFLTDMGEPLPGMSLDRIDVNGNYEPKNCRWATQKTQQNNRTNTRWLELNGERVRLTELAERYGISYRLLRQRIGRDGMSVAEAVKP